MKLTQILLLGAFLCLVGSADVFLTGRVQVTGRTSVGTEGPSIVNGPLLSYGNELDGWGFAGSRVALAGHSAWFEFDPHWAFSVTCDPVSDTCDAGRSGYIPTGAETVVDFANGTQSGVYITSTGRLPNGILGQFGYAQATYHICDISGRTFTLRRGWQGFVNTNGATVTRVNGPDFIDNLEAGRVVSINGINYTIASLDSASQLTLTSSAGVQSTKVIDSQCAGTKQTFTDAGSGDIRVLWDPFDPNYYITSFVGAPAGSTMNWSITQPSGVAGELFFDGTYHYFYRGNSPATLELAIPAGSSPGVYTITVTLNTAADGTGASTRSSFEVEVLPFTPVTTGTPSSYPAIPHLSEWENVMTSALPGGGAYWCDKTTGVLNPSTLSFGNETEIWYYDGARVFSQIANYTGDAAWNNCRNTIAGQYQAYVDGASGSVPGYRRFPHGLALQYEATGTASYKTSVDQLCSRDFAELGGRVDGKTIRETSYVLDCYNVQERDLMETRPVNMVRTAEFLMGDLLSNSDAGYHSAEQQFYNGLAYEALIDYYELTGDERVPWVLVRSMAHAWETYNQTTHIMPYSSYAEGPYCAYLTKVWFRLDNDGSCGITTGMYSQRILNLLYGHAWAWMFRHTGNDLYRVQGDEFFEYVLQDNEDGFPFSGKEFSQVYRLGFAYVERRQAP